MDIEVGNKSHSQVFIHIRIIIDHLADGVDKLDNKLGHKITGCCLATEYKGLRRNTKGGITLKSTVQGDNVQHIKMLTLIFMDTLNLNIKQPGRIQFYAGMVKQVSGEFLLVRLLDGTPFLTKCGIIGKGFKFLEFMGLRKPAIANRAGD